mgnify:CR=1 FL=1
MKTSLKTSIAVAATLAMLATSSVHADTVHYFDGFSGNSTINLHGTTPDTTFGANTWIANTIWKADGTTVQGTGGVRSAYLPFGPEIGKIYTLTVVLAKPTSTSAGWGAFGFTEGRQLDRFFGKADDLGSVDANPWMLYRTNLDAVAAFAGPGTANNSGNLTPYTDTLTMSVVLNTEQPAWTAEWFVDGASVHTHTYATNPTIDHIGISSNIANVKLHSLSLSDNSSVAPFALTITPATPTATGYDLEWKSQTGKLYNLRTSTDLQGTIADWDLIQSDIVADPPVNVANVQADGERRFYAVEEFEVPPNWNIQDGAIIMSDGIVNTSKLSIPFDDAGNSVDYMKLNGGIVHAGQLAMGTQGQMDIAGGMLVIDGNVVSTVNRYISGDLIRGYNASGTLRVEYNTAAHPGKTMVHAYPDPVEWVISFEDGFRGDKLDENKWENPNWNGGANRFADNVEVSDGNLILKTIRRDPGDGDVRYTSGTVSSKHFQRFGYWEASIKITDAPGVNNAFWLNTPQLGPDPINNPQPLSEHTDRLEIDIQEIHWPDELNMGIHDWRPTHSHFGGKRRTVTENLAADFQKYSFRWDENDNCFWYFNDVQVHSASAQSADSQSEVETLFSSLVKSFAGSPNANTDGSRMTVEWLRVFKRAPNANKPNPSYNTAVVSINTLLSWTAGHDFPADINGHDVYFGTDFSTVKNATRSSPEYKGAVSTTSFDPGLLDHNTTYYWRIDQVNGSDISEGYVWRFTTQAP